MEKVTDCLVLCIDDLLTVKIFVLYDVNEKRFFIRGKNYDDDEKDEDTDFDSSSSSYETDSLNKFETGSLNKPFSFQCKIKKHLIRFIKYLVSINSYELSLYNYDNLPNASNNVTYEFLENNQDKRNEIVCYERINFDKKICLNLLNILKNIYNDF